MADQVLTNLKFILYDRMWPGKASSFYGVPPDGFTGASHHNVATEVYPRGTKIQVRNSVTGLAGLSTFIYLNLVAQDAANVLAARHVVALHSSAIPYGVTNELATVLGEKLGPVAIGLSAMTTGRWGWFWCGGVAPIDYVAAMEGDFYTLNTVAIGEMGWAQLATPGAVAGELGFEITTAAGEAQVGFALAADA